MSLLNKIWYSQQHLNLLNFMKGQTPEITDTNPLANQIGVYYIGVNQFIRSITSGRVFKPFVIIAFMLFIVLHISTLPFYILVYVYYLLITMRRVYVYAKNPEVLELQARSVFERYPNQWKELVYNMAFRRAVLAAFVTVYKLLQFVKAPNRVPTGVCGLFVLLSKLLLLLLVRLVWVLLFQVSWQIVSRSYRYAMAFSNIHSYKNFRVSIIRTRIINNHQSDDLRPGLYLRIYKDDKSKWNFNPGLIRYLNNAKVSRLTEDKIFKDCVKSAVGTGDTFLHNNHVTSSYVIGTAHGYEIVVYANNTSGWRTEDPSSWISYKSPLPIKSKIQSMTSPQVTFTNLLDWQSLNYSPHDFRTFLEDSQMLRVLLVGKLFMKNQTALHLLEVRKLLKSAGLNDTQFTMDPELKSYMGFMEQFYESSSVIDEPYTNADKLSYVVQILHSHDPAIFSNVSNFKLLHDDDDFYDRFM